VTEGPELTCQHIETRGRARNKQGIWRVAAQQGAMQRWCLGAEESTGFSARPETSDGSLLRLSFCCRHRAAAELCQ